MKRIVCKLLSIFLVLALVLAISSCSGDIDSYSAVMMTRSASDNSGSVSFGSLTGRVSLNVRNTYTQDTTLSFTATLGDGELSVYYKGRAQGVELPLFEITGGESSSESGVGYLTNGEDFTLIFKTPEGVTARDARVTVTVDAPRIPR